MNERHISQPFVYSQSYQVDDMSNPSMYTESFTLNKIYIEGIKNIQIRNLKQFVLNEWKKNSPSSSPKLGFIFSDNLEESVWNTNYLYLTDNINVVKPNNVTETIQAPTDRTENIFRFVYREVPISNFGDFKNLNSFNSSYNNFFNFPINKNVSDVINQEINFENSNYSKYLYIVSYCPELLQGEFYFSGNLNFFLRGE